MKKKFFHNLYQQHVGLLLHIADGFQFSREQSEELVQEAFVRLWQQEGIETPHQAKAFLITATKNACIDCYRKQKRRRTSASSDTLDHLASEGQALWARDDARTSLLSSAYQAIKVVSEKKGCKEFKKFYLDEMTLTAIADDQGEPTGTIKARVHRCRKKYSKVILDSIV